MAYSPRGIFTGFSQLELDALRAAALARMVNGSRTSLSGGGKTSSKSWDGADPADILAEIKFAEQQNGKRAPRASKVYQTLNNQYRCRQ